MSVVLFCALAYNRDLQGARCGYDCLAISMAIAVNTGPAVEVAYAIATQPTATEGEMNHVDAGSISAEMTYVGVTAKALARVVSPILEVGYAFDETRFLTVTNVRAEVALWRYQVPARARLLLPRVELAYTADLSQDQASPTRINQGQISAEYTCVPLLPTSKPTIYRLPQYEVAYATSLEPSSPSEDSPYLHCSSIGMECTWARALGANSVYATKNSVKSPVIEVCYTGSAGTGTVIDSNYAVTGIMGEVSYTSVPNPKLVSLASMSAEASYTSATDVAATQLYLSSVTAEVTYSSWTGSSSPAVLPWQVVVGNNPLQPEMYSDSAYVTGAASDATLLLNMATGVTKSMCYSPATVMGLWGDALVTYCNNGITVQDVTTLACTYIAADYNLVDILAIDNTLVALFNTGKIGVMSQGSQELAYYACPDRGMGIVYDAATQTYGLGTADGKLYFLSSTYAVIGSLDLAGEIVQLQASQYGNAPCFVVAARGARAVLVFSATSPYQLLSAIAIDGTLASGIYSRADLSFIATKSNSSSVFKARSNLLWSARSPSIQGLPKFLTVAGSRVYFTDASAMTAGWI